MFISSQNSAVPKH